MSCLTSLRCWISFLYVQKTFFPFFLQKSLMVGLLLCHMVLPAIPAMSNPATDEFNPPDQPRGEVKRFSCMQTLLIMQKLPDRCK
ncbi:hypothetical protein GGR50DRAFT_636574 [Xylaria sp. CBS 124048]|nr:hypothetical protein GGR50DRAFT_636574 [Xylaria sp. CBS 124048]